MTVLGLQNIHFVAEDVEVAAQFWQQAMGLALRFRDDDRWVQMTAGHAPLAIASKAEGHPDQIGAIPVFEVDDVEAHICSIGAHGGKLLDDREMGSHGRVVTFEDPQGNVAQLFKRSD